MAGALRRTLLCSLALSLGAAACADKAAKPSTNGATSGDPATGTTGGDASTSGGPMSPTGTTGEADASRDDAGPAPIVPADISLPEYPFYPNDSIDPDAEVLAEQGGRWCATKPEDDSNAAFYYGWMPLDTVDRLCAPRQPDWPTIEKLMGNMYLSGYFGGIWFRDNAQSGGLGRPGGTGQGSTSEGDFSALADKVRERIDLSTKGKDEDVLAHVLASTASDVTKTLESTPLIYAYNKGYAQSVLDNAPATIQNEPPFTCVEFLDCQTPGVLLNTFERFRPSLAKLKANTDTCAAPLIGARPTDTEECRWAEMQDREDNSKTWETVGAGLWLGGDFTDETYKTLLTINAGYLLVAGAAFVGSMQGWADEDQEAGRCAILVDTAAYIWNQGYFQGLNSSQKGQEVDDAGVITDLGPQVVCPGEAGAVMDGGQ